MSTDVIPYKLVPSELFPISVPFLVSLKTPLLGEVAKKFKTIVTNSFDPDDLGVMEVVRTDISVPNPVLTAVYD